MLSIQTRILGPLRPRVLSKAPAHIVNYSVASLICMLPMSFRSDTLGFSWLLWLEMTSLLQLCLTFETVKIQLVYWVNN